MAEHPRLILRNFLSPDICKELEFIHKSSSTVGYRANVLSTTLPHLIATNSAHLIIPFLPIRERLKEKVEEHFGCEYELFVEFTGLISWCKGASIGWHSDDNRVYLKQRDFAAVCYLNSYEVDFSGGLFHFQDGEPSTIAPMAGDVIIYTADERNIHSVSEIRKGERATLTLWFSRDASHDEDAKLLTSLSHSLLNNTPPIGLCFPTLASNNMYWFPPEEASRFQSGFDMRTARLNVLGFDVFSSSQDCYLSKQEDSCKNFLELLKGPLYLACGDKLIASEFVNILHALQVVQFYDWKKGKEFETGEDVIIQRPVSEIERRKIDCLKVELVKDAELADTLVGHVRTSDDERSFDSVRFSAMVCEWESYTVKLRKQMAMSLPYWTKHQSIFSVVDLE
ncbi:prolyl 3-hydroxylase 1 [Phtheirospermum japonicum]|uniref:procollagen-proline 3-dioxygenase n=1 Tax=Phtheirospermum japonicum TaxID=374723 RepID=A0A830CY10_9LAMI|nr:prolyl 3-hydroxylase 1 [Phtheirospermum japonicum]